MSVVIPIGKEGGARSSKEVEDPSKATNSILLVGSGGLVGKELSFSSPPSSGRGDEKKKKESPDCTDIRAGVRSSNLVLQGGHDDHSGIPRALVGRHFADIDTLHDELELLGLSDSKFILTDDGLVAMPGDERNGGARFIRRTLDNYIKGWFGEWGFVDCDNSQEINKLTPRGRQARREPDVNFWLPEKCEFSGKIMKVRERPGTKVDVDPDVFFQFSWGNTEPREFLAMNDLLTLGGFGAGNMGPPRVGVLVKVRRENDSDVGIDVYKVFSGCTVADAIAGNNGCTHHYYDHQNHPNNDIKVAVTAGEFGYSGFLARFYSNFEMSLRELWDYASLG